MATNEKLGALLEGDGGFIYIDGLDHWPEGFYTGTGKGKLLRVTGTVINRDDVPVYIQKPGEPVRAAVAVQSEKELARAKWRFLLKDAKWTALD